MKGILDIVMYGSMIKTGVQQIMIGNCCQNYDSALAALKAIKAAGYNGIELNDFMVKKTPVIVRLLTKMAGMPVGRGGKLDWHKLILESGLSVISLHSNLNRIEQNTEEVIEEAREFGTDTVVITGMYRFDYSNIDQVVDLAIRLNEAGRRLAQSGIKLLYHNHNVELQKVAKDKTAYDILIEHTDSCYVNFELDTYWMIDGGADAAKIMQRLGNRMVMWHINDRGCRKKGPYMTPIVKPDSMELGTGNIDLDNLMELAVENGVEAIVLESHKNWIDNDPIKSLNLSAKWLFKKCN